MHEKLTWEEVEEEVTKFKEKFIYPTIVNKEVEEESMMWWLQKKLSRHSYDDADNNYESEDDDDENENTEKDESTEKTNVDQTENKSAVSS